MYSKHISMYSKHNFIDECMYENNHWKVKRWFSGQTHFCSCKGHAFPFQYPCGDLQPTVTLDQGNQNPPYYLHTHHTVIQRGTHANITFIYIK